MDIKMMVTNKRILILLLITFLFDKASAQPAKADSLHRLLQQQTTDTSKIRLMWQLGSAISFYAPDSALNIAQQALYLARKAGYMEGESRSLGVLANAFIRIGNYNQALQLNIEKLKLEEQRQQPRNLASVLMNIGVVYSMQEEFDKALEYYNKSDSVIRQYAIPQIDYNVALNKGDAYDRQNRSDSSFRYFSLALALAQQRNEPDLVGAAMTGLGHAYRKQGMYGASKQNYIQAITYLTATNDDEILSEACLGLARLYDEHQAADSAGIFAGKALQLASKGNFLRRELETAIFLSDHYHRIKRVDSAFKYLTYARVLNDSIYSKDKIREYQVLSSNEKFRQNELEEEKRKEKTKRRQQLQILLIAVFIPAFFLLTFLLSRINIPIRFIRLLGILSLLFLFEYLTLLLHPRVAAFTHHTPIYEILIFVAIATFIIPLHHRMEHWVIKKLTHHRITTPPLNPVPVAESLPLEKGGLSPKHISIKKPRPPTQHGHTHKKRKK